MTNELERRFYTFEPNAEKRDDGSAQISGRPIVYNSPTDIGGMFREIIMPGALDGADLRDVPLLVNHNDRMIPVARSRRNNGNSTMQLIPREERMDIRVDLDTENNMESRALYSATQRGDISGMSFMMIVNRDKDVWTDVESDYPKRRIMEISKILEVSAVAFPAYEQTSIQVASQDGALDSARASLESAKKRLAEERAAQEAAEAAEKAAQAEAERRTALLERLDNLRKEEK